MKTRSLRRLWIPLVTAGFLWAHGGVLLLHDRVGSFLISLFSADAPLRAGAQNFTVLVEDASDSSPVLDSRVTLSFRDAGAHQIRIEAQIGQSTNKLLYAASTNLTAGTWRVTISVQSKAGAESEASGTLTILPEEPPIAAYWPYFAVPPVVVLLFVLNRWLKRRSKSRKTGTAIHEI